MAWPLHATVSDMYMTVVPVLLGCKATSSEQDTTMTTGCKHRPRELGCRLGQAGGGSLAEYACCCKVGESRLGKGPLL